MIQQIYGKKLKQWNKFVGDSMGKFLISDASKIKWS